MEEYTDSSSIDFFRPFRRLRTGQDIDFVTFNIMLLTLPRKKSDCQGVPLAVIDTTCSCPAAAGDIGQVSRAYGFKEAARQGSIVNLPFLSTGGWSRVEASSSVGVKCLHGRLTCRLPGTRPTPNRDLLQVPRWVGLRQCMEKTACNRQKER